MNETDDSDAWPEWGSLPLDQYMLAQWDDGSKISTDQQQLQLVHSYVATGSTDRAKYAEQAKQGHIQPSKDQISRILRSFRAPALRRTAGRLLNHKGNFIWLRTDYKHDEQRQALIRTLTSSDLYDSWTKYLSEGSLVLSDARLFNLGTQWERVLDLLPEIADCKLRELPDGYRSDIRFHRERVKRGYMEWDRSYYDEGEPDDELLRIIESESTSSESPMSREEAEARLFKTRVVDCHALACETILLVEDAETYATDPVTLKFLWLDDRAAVVRQARATAEEVDEFLVRVDLCWEDTCFLYADVGPEYARGGGCGPPYASVP